MKTHYVKLTTSFIFKLLKIYKTHLEDENEELLENFGSIEELKEYELSYLTFTENKDKIDKIENILEHHYEIDIIIKD